MYRKKRNKRSDAHDMMDKTFKSIVHPLRLRRRHTEKCTSSSQLPALVSSSD
jgi:hypothetical protein